MPSVHRITDRCPYEFGITTRFKARARSHYANCPSSSDDAAWRCLNVVSEKRNTGDNREADSRYSTTEYCAAAKNLGSASSPVCQVKTSRGHLLIDYTASQEPTFKIISEAEDLIDKFIAI